MKSSGIFDIKKPICSNPTGCSYFITRRYTVRKIEAEKEKSLMSRFFCGIKINKNK